MSLLALKRRPWQKGLLLIASSVQQLEPFIDESVDLQKAINSWPGPVTWVVPAAEGVSHYLRGEHQGIAVRVTDHPLAALLCRIFKGPIVSTSANPARQVPALSACGVRRYFGHKVDLIVDGSLGGLEKPTPIYDLLTGKAIRD